MEEQAVVFLLVRRRLGRIRANLKLFRQMWNYSGTEF